MLYDLKIYLIFNYWRKIGMKKRNPTIFIKPAFMLLFCKTGVYSARQEDTIL